MFGNNTANAYSAPEMRAVLNNAKIKAGVCDGSFEVAEKAFAAFVLVQMLGAVLPLQERRELMARVIGDVAQSIEDYADDCEFGSGNGGSPIQPDEPSPGLDAGKVNVVDNDGIEASGAFEDCECYVCNEKRENYAKKQKAEAEKAQGQQGIKGWFDPFEPIPNGIKPDAKPVPFPSQLRYDGAINRSGPGRFA